MRTPASAGSAVIARVAAEPVDAGHADVHQHDVGHGARAASARPRRRRRPRRRPSMSASCVEQRTQAAAHQLLVVGEQHPDHGRPSDRAAGPARRSRGPAAARPSSVPPTDGGALRHARRCRCRRSAAAAPRRGPTLVEHVDVERVAVGPDPHDGRRRVGVAGDVGERLLHDAERREIDVARQRRDVERAVDLEPHPTPAASVRAIRSSSSSRLGVGQPAAASSSTWRRTPRMERSSTSASLLAALIDARARHRPAAGSLVEEVEARRRRWMLISDMLWATTSCSSRAMREALLGRLPAHRLGVRPGCLGVRVPGALRTTSVTLSRAISHAREGQRGSPTAGASWCPVDDAEPRETRRSRRPAVASANRRWPVSTAYTERDDERDEHRSRRAGERPRQQRGDERHAEGGHAGTGSRAGTASAATTSKRHARRRRAAPRRGCATWRSPSRRPAAASTPASTASSRSTSVRRAGAVRRRSVGARHRDQRKDPDHRRVVAPAVPSAAYSRRSSARPPPRATPPA